MTICLGFVGDQCNTPFSPLGKGGPIVGFSAVQTTFLMFKNVRGWNHEQTQGNKNFHSNMFGTLFSKH